jgi:hypothetical protein
MQGAGMPAPGVHAIVFFGTRLSDDGVGVGLGDALGLPLGVGLGEGVGEGDVLGAGLADGIANTRTVLSPLFAT